MRFFRYILIEADSALTVAVFLTVGIGVGALLVRWIVALGESPVPPLLLETEVRRPPSHWWRWLVVLGTGLMFAALAVAMFRFECQKTPEVQPDDVWRFVRLFYHLVLVCLLITATGTDFRDYTIPDWITVPGIMVGVLAATASGQLQIIHVWVDWHHEIRGLHGPYLPDWLDAHRHLHGFVWSVCGLVTGAGTTWIVRAVSKLVLGREAMGFGDVTLMAMIGSFIGWQPVVVVFFLAPLCGIVMSLLVRVFTNKTFIPYGPFLSGAAVIVLFSWRWIWMLEVPWSASNVFSIRRLFGDWQSLLILAGISLVTLVGMLGLVRVYWSVPMKRRQDDRQESDSKDHGQA